MKCDFAVYTFRDLQVIILCDKPFIANMIEEFKDFTEFFFGSRLVKIFLRI